MTNGGVSKGSSHHGPTLSNILQFFACVAVIYTAYITQGIVSEELAKQTYGEQQHRFKNMEALVGFQCITCFLWAVVLGCIFRVPKTANMPSIGSYAFMGLTNVIGPVCGVYALKKISYPAQVLAKSCKSVPIMLTGALLYRKRYSMQEYASVVAVGLGVGMFALLSGKSKGALSDANPVLGYSLVLVNLLLDSLTNTTQDDLKRRHPDVTGLHMMRWVNFWGGAYYAIAFFGLSSVGMDVIRFCLEHRAAGVHLLSFCLCGAIGQLGIFWMVSLYGTLVTSIVCTTRKFFSILASVLFVSRQLLTPAQFGAVGLVFAGLLCKSVLRLRGSMAQKAKSQ